VKSQRQASRSVTRGRSWLISDEYSVFNGGASRQLLPLATGVQTPCLKTLMINKATSLKWYCDRLSRTCESRCHSRYHLWCVNATVGEEERHEKMSLQYVRWRSVVTMQALVVGARHADEMLERTRRQRGYQPQAVLLSASTSLWASLFSQASQVVCRCQFRRLKGGQEEVDLQSKRIARWF
jgi:hypothetical protein